MTPQSCSPLRVLIVDDCQDTANSLADALDACGYSAHAVYGGQEALLTCEEQRFDVILIDLLMPGINGFQLAMALSDQISLQRPFLVAVSGLVWESEFLQEFDSGFDACLVKPYDLKKLLAILKTCEASQHSRREPCSA